MADPAVRAAAAGGGADARVAVGDGVRAARHAQGSNAPTGGFRRVVGWTQARGCLVSKCALATSGPVEQYFFFIENLDCSAGTDYFKFKGSKTTISVYSVPMKIAKCEAGAIVFT